MLSANECKKLDRALKSIPDDQLEQLLRELYAYADFFWDQWIKAGNSVPSVSRKDIEAAMKSEV